MSNNSKVTTPSVSGIVTLLASLVEKFYPCYSTSILLLKSNGMES